MTNNILPYFNAENFINIIGALLLVISGGVLISRHILPNATTERLEIVYYIVSIAAITNTKWWFTKPEDVDIAYRIALVGIVALPIVVDYSLYKIRHAIVPYNMRYTLKIATGLFWASQAFLWDSLFIGTISSISIVYGFHTMWYNILRVFNYHNIIPSITLSCGLVITTYLYANQNGSVPEDLNKVMYFGMVNILPFLYYGSLIIESKNSTFNDMFTICSFIGGGYIAIYIGDQYLTHIIRFMTVLFLIDRYYSFWNESNIPTFLMGIMVLFIPNIREFLIDVLTNIVDFKQMV